MAENDPIAFDLSVTDGRGLLLLVDRTVHGWLKVGRLELEIPDLAFPVDVAGGALRFQRRRCRLRAVELVVDDRALAELLRARGAALGAAGFDEVRARVLEGTIELSGRARRGERRADLTVRAQLREDGRGVRVTTVEPRLYGSLLRPAALVAHDLITALTRDDERAAPRGLGEVVLQPLDTFLWETLPAAGWRLPDATRARVLGLATMRGRVELRYGEGTFGEGTNPDAAREVLRAGDERLLAGDPAGALLAYRAELAKGGPSAQQAWARQLDVLAADEATFREAEATAREALGRWPDFVPAHLALAAVLAERGRERDAAACFGRAAEIAEEAGDDEDAVRAAVAAARLVRASDVGAATPYYERALERRPGHAEAAEALMDAYASGERWSEVVRVSRRRLGALTDPVDKGREHARLGEIYLQHLGDPERAREELTKATRYTESEPRAWDALARALVAVGDAPAAAAALERQIELHAAKGDAVGEARAHTRVGVLWEARGDDAQAHLRYRRALELVPSDPDVLARLAGVAARRGHLADALDGYERLAELEGTDDARRRGARRELARLYLAAQDTASARRHLERAQGGEEAERLELLSQAEENDGTLDAAVVTLERLDALSLPTAKAADLALRKARLLDALGRDEEAEAARARAFALDPDAAGVATAQALAARARARGDAPAEAVWLEALLQRTRDPERSEVALRLAELAYTRGDSARALGLLDEAGEAPDARAVKRLRAHVLRAMGDARASAAILEELAAESTTAEGVALLTSAARALAAADDPAAALRTAREAVERARGLLRDGVAADLEGARAVLGEVAWKVRAWDDVATAYEGTGGVEAARRLGLALERLGRDHDATSVYRAAIAEADAVGEALVAAWRRLSELADRRGEHDAAAEALSRCADDPRTGETAWARAEAHYRAAEIRRRRLGDRAAALAELDVALRLVPEHMPSLDALESIHNEEGDHERVAAILGRKIAATARQPERQKALLARLAELQQRLGRPDVAREAFRRALELDPSYRPALRWLAAEARDRGDADDAAALFRRLADALAGDDDPSVDEERRAALREADAGGEPPPAPAGAGTSAGVLPAPATAEAAAEALGARARALAAQGASLDPDGHALLGRLRELAHAEGRFAPLADGLAAAATVEADAGSAVAWFTEAASLRRSALGDVPGAIDALTRALALRPRSGQLVGELRDLLEKSQDDARLAEVYEAHLMALDGPARAPVAHALGRLCAARLGDRERALRMYAEAHASDASYREVWLPLANLQYAHGEPAAAEEPYRLAVDAGLVPVEDLAVVWTRLGQLAADRGDPQAAIPRFRRALEALEGRRPAGTPHHPYRAKIAQALEAALRAANDWEALVEHLLQRAREAPDVAARVPLLDEAAALLEGPLGQPDEAEDVRHEIARLRGERRRSRERPAADGNVDAGPPPPELELPEATAQAPPATPAPAGDRSAFRRELRAEEDWPALLLALDEDADTATPDVRAGLLAEGASVAADHLGDLDGALDRLGKAMAAAGDETERALLQSARAELLSRLGRIDEARADAAEVLAVIPPPGLAHLALGRIAVAQGDPATALPHLIAAADRDELDVAVTAEAHLLAGHAHEALGQIDNAVARYEQASALDPFDPRPLDALEMIATVRGETELLAEILGRRILMCASGHERARLWVRRARLYRDELGRDPEAYRCYKEAFANDPSYLEATQALRIMAALRGEWGLAAELLYREIESTEELTEKATLHVELALIYEERLHDVDAAIRNHESALALDPGETASPPALARLYARAERLPEAAHAEETAAALELLPNDRAARLLRAGEHMERAGWTDDAARLYAQAAGVPGGGEPAGIARAKAARLGGEARRPDEIRAELETRLAGDIDPGERVTALRQLLRLAMDAGDDDAALARTAEILVRDPGDLPAFLERRRLLSARGEWTGVVDLYRSRADTVEDATERANLYFELGRLSGQKLGDAGRAALAFGEALRIDPEHAPSLDALADMAYRQHDWERAHALYGRLQPEASFLGTDAVHYRRGELAEMLGYEDDAEIEYRATVAHSPTHLPALEALARLALYRGDVTAAIAALRGVLDLLPLDDVERITTMRQQLGELCQRAGDAAAARGYLELVLVEDPTRPAALEPLAELYASAGQWDKTINILQRLSYVVASPEKRADVLYRIGEIHRLRLGDDDRASEAYLKAIDLDEHHAPTLRRLIDYYWAQGDDAGLLELGDELDGRGALIHPDTPVDTLARVAVAAARGGDVGRASALVRGLGDAAVGALAMALADAAARAPSTIDLIAAAARALCAPPGPSIDAVRAVLAMRASKDERSAKLAAEL